MNFVKNSFLKQGCKFLKKEKRKKSKINIEAKKKNFKNEIF